MKRKTWCRTRGFAGRTRDRSKVRDTAAYLATTTTRLAINLTQSARARRETHIGSWLPEPVDAGADLVCVAERGEALELAVLMLLERLSPTERAAYVLREAFDYPYRRISQVLALSEANARQLVTRARRRLYGEHRRPVDATGKRQLLDAFVAAAQTGDLATLERLLAADVVPLPRERPRPTRSSTAPAPPADGLRARPRTSRAACACPRAGRRTCGRRSASA